MPTENKKSENKKSEDKKSETKKSDAPKVPLVGPYVVPQGGYGGFSGHFSTEIEDEEKKISLRKWTEPQLSFPKRKLVADMIFRLLNKPKIPNFLMVLWGTTKT